MRKKRLKQENSVDFNIQKSKKLKELAQIIESYKKFGITDKDIKAILKKDISKIPLCIFKDTKLSPFEIIVKYLRENCNLSFKEISKIVNRKISTLTSLYSKIISKQKKKLLVYDYSSYVPISVIYDRKLSVLESIVAYLKDSSKMKFSEIARALSKDRRTIWTVYKRGKKKYD